MAKLNTLELDKCNYCNKIRLCFKSQTCIACAQINFRLKNAIKRFQ